MFGDYIPTPLSEPEQKALFAKYAASLERTEDARLEVASANARAQLATTDIATGERAGAAEETLATLRAEVLRHRVAYREAIEKLRVATNAMEALKSEIEYAAIAFQMAEIHRENSTSDDYPVDAHGHLTLDALQRAIGHVEPTGSLIRNEVAGDPLTTSPTLLLGEAVRCSDPRALSALRKHIRARGDVRQLRAKLIGL